MNYSLLEHTWEVYISHYAWQLHMLVIIYDKYRKNPLTTVTHSFNKFTGNLITSTTQDSRKMRLKKSQGLFVAIDIL